MSNTKSVLEKNVVEIFPSAKSLEQRLKEGKKLKVYLGVDPSSPEIHLGHAIPLQKLAEFQNEGHEVFLLIGDFTGMIGDPTGKDKSRQPLTREEVKKNSKDYQKQAEKILDFRGKNAAKIVYNSTWLDNLSFKNVIELAANFTVQQMLERDMFQKRLEERRPIALHEFLYPLMQGYDSVQLEADVEIGGTDQTFNMLIGRQLVRNILKKEKFVLTLPLLPGTDGQKMSKSLQNTIPLGSGAEDMFGKIMSIKDNLLPLYLETVSTFSKKEIEEFKKGLENKKRNPIEIKKALAQNLVAHFYSNQAASTAESEFTKVFQKKELPTTIPEISLPKPNSGLTVLDLVKLSRLAPSSSAASRLIEQGGVEIDNKTRKLPNERLGLEKEATLLKVGKRSFLKIVWR